RRSSAKVGQSSSVAAEKPLDVAGALAPLRPGAGACVAGPTGTRDSRRTNCVEDTGMAEEKKLAIVTGAASGIGRARTLGVRGRGIDVAAVDRNETSLAALAATVHDKPGAMQSIPADLARPESFDRIVSTVLNRFGRIDVLVNNAGIGQASVK